jgi:dodecin
MIVKVIEILSHSPNSWEEAAQNAVTEASRSIRDIKSIYIKEFSAKIKDNKIDEYRVNAKISFVVE